jgi:putative endonuclease
MPSAKRRQLGAFGEAAAAAYLSRQGYIISERNWRCQLGEIDLIALKGDQVVFVEVRTRQNASHGSAEESVTVAKQERLIGLAYTYLEAHGMTANTAWRIDVIGVTLDKNGRITHLSHIPNAIEQQS